MRKTRSAAAQQRQAHHANYQQQPHYGVPHGACGDLQGGLDPMAMHHIGGDMSLPCTPPTSRHMHYSGVPYAPSPRGRSLGLALKQMGMFPLSYNPYAAPLPIAGTQHGQGPSTLALLNDFLERSYELQERAHRLWVAEQTELQRGVDRAIISTGLAADISPHKKCDGHPGLGSPVTAKASLAPPRDLLMTPPSASMLLTHALTTAHSPIMTAHTASQLLSPTALGLHPEGLELHRPRSAMGGLGAFGMPCSPIMGGQRPVVGLGGMGGLGGQPKAGRGCMAMDTIGTLEYPAASMAQGMHNDPRHGLAGPGGERGGMEDAVRRSSHELRRQRQLQLQQDMDTSAPHTSTHASAGALYFPHDLSPLSPNELLVSSQAMPTSCLDAGLVGDGLLDVFGGHSHADVHLVSSPHLRVTPISTKRTHH